MQFRGLKCQLHCLPQKLKSMFFFKKSKGKTLAGSAIPYCTIFPFLSHSCAVESCYLKDSCLLSDGSGTQTRNRIFRYPESARKMGLRQVEQGFSSFFAKIFGIFDDFSKFHSVWQKFGKK